MARFLSFVVAALLLFAGSAIAAPPVTGPLQAQNSFSEILNNGTQTAAQNNIGLPQGNVINAIYKGLKCDGSTDNASIFAALASYATSAPFSTIYFPAQTSPCLTSATFIVPANTTLWAYPGTVTIKPTPGSSASPLLINIANVNNVLVYGLTFDGGGASNSNTNNVTQVYSANNAVFDHVRVQNTSGIGTLFSLNITNSGVRDSFYTNVGNLWVTSGLWSDQRQAIAFCCGTVAGNLNNFVTGSTFTSLTGSIDGGIGLDSISAGSQTGFLAADNQCYLSGGLNQAGTGNAGACVYVEQSVNAIIIGNVASGESGAAIDTDQNSGITISGNMVQKSGLSGITYAHSISGTITGNVSINNNQTNGADNVYQAGLVFGSPSNFAENTVGLTISGNVFSDTQSSPTQTYGIQEYTTGAGLTVSGIYIDRNNLITGNITSQLSGVDAVFAPPTSQVYLFASVPSCGYSTKGQHYFITDSTTNTWGATISGSGSDQVEALCNGANLTVEGK